LTLNIKIFICIKYNILKNNYLLKYFFRPYTKDTKRTTRETGERGRGEKGKAKTGSRGNDTQDA